MERRHLVVLYGQQVGVIYQRGDHTTFAFDEGYWRRADRPVLGLNFENSPFSDRSASSRLPPWFSNLLPEGRLRDWIAADRGVSPSREMELLAQVGHDLPGAMVVVPDTGEIPTEDRAAAARRSIDGSGSHEDDSRLRFSLAGVGLKFSMLQVGHRLTLPASGAGGDWIVKLPDANHAEVPCNEYAMMSWASQVGIDVPEVALRTRDELPDLPAAAWPNREEVAYVISRFDRRDAGSKSVHIEDLAQVKGVYPDAKYGGNFETIAGLIYRGRDIRSLQEFVRRMTFNLLVGNGDAHLKNWSMIYPDRRTAQLSPAYDIVSTASYFDDRNPEDLGLKFGGSKRFEKVTWRTFAELERKLHAEAADLVGVMQQTVRRAAETWGTAADNLDALPATRIWINQNLERTTRRLMSPQ